jgi:hypothetical protein
MREREIRRVDLVRILRAEGSAIGNQEVADLLASLSVEKLVLKAVPTTELRQIYERRRVRMPDTHPLAQSVDRLLAALADYRDAEVYAMSLEIASRVVAVWLSSYGDAVISALVDGGL